MKFSRTISVLPDDSFRLKLHYFCQSLHAVSLAKEAITLHRNILFFFSLLQWPVLSYFLKTITYHIEMWFFSLTLDRVSWNFKVSEKNHISISWILDPITLFPITYHFYSHYLPRGFVIFAGRKWSLPNEDTYTVGTLSHAPRYYNIQIASIGLFYYCNYFGFLTILLSRIPQSFNAYNIVWRRMLLGYWEFWRNRRLLYCTVYCIVHLPSAAW